METKRKLRQRIAQLEAENSDLRSKEFRSAIIEKADLPKCVSRACLGCRWVVIESGLLGRSFLLGCGKGCGCAGYSPIQTIRTITPNNRFPVEF